MGAVVKFTTKAINAGALAVLAAKLKRSKQVAQIGFPDSVSHKPDGTSVAYIASIHEYGAPEAGIPERPFLSVGIKKGKPEQARLNRINLVKILNTGFTFEQALTQLGIMAVGQVQEYIVEGTFAPLKPQTIKRKKSTKPLIDTGQMRQSVTYEIGEQE